MKQIQLNKENQGYVSKALKILMRSVDIEEQLNNEMYISLAEVGRVILDRIHEGQVFNIPAINGTVQFNPIIDSKYRNYSIIIEYDPTQVELISVIYFIGRCLPMTIHGKNIQDFENFLDLYRVI